MKNIKGSMPKFGVMDIFLIVLVLASAAGIAGRYVLTDKNGILASSPENTRAVVQVLISNIEDTSSDYFVEGASFSVGETGAVGVVGDCSVTPAERYAENEAGELYITYDDEENGRKDVRCTIILTGRFRDGIFTVDGRNAADGTEAVLPGAEMTLADDSITVTALILDVTAIE